MPVTFTERAAREILRQIRLLTRRTDRAERLAQRAARATAGNPVVEFAILTADLTEGGTATGNLCVWDGTEYAENTDLPIDIEDLHNWASGETGEIIPVIESAKRGKFEVPIPIASPEIGQTALATMSSGAAAAASGKITSGQAGIHSWTGSSPADIDTALNSSGTGLTITVWNPHNVAIPTDTLVLLGKTASGWIIIAAVNYCPS